VKRVWICCGRVFEGFRLRREADAHLVEQREGPIELILPGEDAVDLSLGTRRKRGSALAQGIGLGA
jgi:hypothetical protein